MQSSDPQPERQTLDDRLTKLEFLFLHLERQLAEVNQVVLEQGRALEALRREVARAVRLGSDAASDSEEFG